MAATFSPDPSIPIHFTAGVPINQTLTFTFPIGIGGSYIEDAGLTTSAGGVVYLQTGAQVFPGVTLQANPDGGGGWPSTNLYTDGISIRIPISGTPTGASGYTYNIYAKGRYNKWNSSLADYVLTDFAVTYTIVIDSASTFQLSPASNISVPTLIERSVGTDFLVGSSAYSKPIYIQNGVGPYKVTLFGLEGHPEMGLSESASVPGTIVQSLPSTASTSVYLVGNPSGPTGGGGQSFTLQVIDLSSANPTPATYAGTYYKYIAVTSGGGTLGISEIGSGSSNLIQSKSASVQFSVVSGGGTGTYNPGAWTLGAGSPPGLSINDSGLVSGVPTTSGSFTFDVNVIDTGSNTGSLTVTWFIQAGATITGGPFHNGTTSTVYTPNTVFNAVGGDGTYRWFISQATALDFGFTANGSTISTLPVLGGYHYKDDVTGTLTIAGTPTSATSGSISVYVTSNGGAITSNTLTSSMTIADSGTLVFSPSSLPNGKQFQAYSQSITSTGSANFLWSASTGLPATFTDDHIGNTTSTLTITGNPTTYTSSANITVAVADATAATGTKTYPFVIDPDIKFVGNTLPTRLANAARGSSYSDFLTFSGGDNTGFTYQINTNDLPAGMTFQASGTNNEILTFSSSNVTQPAQVNKLIPVTVTVNTANRPGNATFTTSFNVQITITGSSSVVMSPFNTTLCAYESPAFSPPIPSVKIGATVTGGATNKFSIITVPAGWAYQGVGSPVNLGSNTGAVFAQGTPSAGAHTFVLQADDDGSVTANTVVTVTTSVSAWPTVTPSTAFLYASGSGNQQTFVAAVPNTCANSNGIWYIDELSPGVNFSSYRGDRTTLTAPNPISVPVKYNLNYMSDELSGQAMVVKAPVVLLPGTSTGNVLNITTGPLANATVSVLYTPVTFTASGNTPSYTWDMIGILPQGMSFSNTGILSGTPTEQGDFSFVVLVHDSSSPVFWAGKWFTLHVNGAGGLALSAISPASGPSTGGTACTLTGSGFLGGDRIFFVSGQAAGISTEQTVGSISGSSISLTTVAHGAVEVNTPVAVALLRGGVYTYNKGTPGVPGTGVFFTYGTPNFSINSFTPDFANADQVPAVNVVVSGQGFDGNCVVQYKPASAGSPTDLATTYNSSTGTLTGTIPNTFFVSPTYSNTTAAITVKRTTDGLIATTGTPFTVRSSDPVITTTSLPDADRTGGIVAYSATLTVAGGVAPYTWSNTGSLPSGIVLSSGGVLSGTVGVGAQTSTPTFKVTDGLGKVGTAAITIHVIGGTIQWVTTALPDARIGSSYSKQLQVTGGTGTYTFTLNTGQFPTPLGVTPSGANAGLISGTPTSANSTGQYFVSLSATDGVLTVGPTSFTMNLLPALPTVTVTSINPTSGPVAGGIAVDIFGTNFANGCSVKFGQTAATGLNYSNIPTRVTATLPPGTLGLVDVTVTNPDTSYGVFPASFEYKSLTSPIIQSISRQDGPFVGGQKVTLYGTNFTGITSVRFGLADDATAQAATWTTSDLNLGVSPQQLTVTTPPGFSFGTGTAPVNVNIYATNPQGTGVLAAGVNGYTYRPAPIITAVVPNSGPTAGGQPIYIIGTNFFSRNGVNPRVFIGDVEIPPSQIVFKEQ